MDKSGRRLRHSQTLSLKTSQRPEVGGDGGGVRFHSLTVMATAPEKWGERVGGRACCFQAVSLLAYLAMNTLL